MLVGCVTHRPSSPARILPEVSESQLIETEDHLPRGIILIEEYHALGVAISSALRKFAPLHVVKVARDFEEAEKFAASLRAELFVLDIDPPPMGEIAFLQAVSARYPGARVLIIAPGVSADLRAEYESAGAIHLFEKPFDLAQFGSIVQALVAPRNGRPTGSGTLRQLGLLDLATVKCLALSTTVLRLESASGAGEIYFQKGQITHAATENHHGEGAVREMADWPLHCISEIELPANAPQTIDLPWTALLLPLIHEFGAHEKQGIPASGSHSATTGASRSGKNILVIDDTEMLLVFVAEVLSQADPDFRVTTALTGEEGLRLAKAEQPDLVLLDYSLSDTTGDQVCQALLKDEATARIPVLMMSGHPTELARTAEDCENVVAALPKPFLSGALVSAVEKALASGPPAQPSPPQPAVKAVEKSPPPFGPETGASLPNGHGPGGDGVATNSEPPLSEPSSEAAAPVSSPQPSLPPPKKVVPPPVTGIFSGPPPSSPYASGSSEATSPAARRTTIFVTISFDVVALELTANLRTASARLEPASRFAAVATADGTIFEAGFQLGPAQLGPDGTIRSLRLIPSGQPIPLPSPVNSFGIGRIQVEPRQHHFALEARAEGSMRVHLTADFVLTGIELSAKFEVSTLLLQRQGREVSLRNQPDNSGVLFTTNQVELDPAGALRAVLVRPLPND